METFLDGRVVELKGFVGPVDFGRTHGILLQYLARKDKYGTEAWGSQEAEQFRFRTSGRFQDDYYRLYETKTKVTIIKET